VNNDVWKQQVESCLALIKLRHQPAFEELYKLTSSKLYGLILKMLPDKDIAADILQESYTKIWLQSDRYRTDLGGAWAWVCQLTRNTAIDKIRSIQRQPLIGDDADLQHLATSDSGIWENEKDLSRCLQAIKQEPRTAIIQAYVYGFSHAELAERLQTPLGTLKSWIKRGLKDLQQCLEA
jgi:RNA polymerase sigma factor, sigma-70 family